MPDIPSIEPSEVVAGDTIRWTKDLSDFPATAWTLNYYLRGPSSQDIAATASGRTHSVTVTAAASAQWPDGGYFWEAFATSGSERYKVGEGYLVVKENSQTSNRTYDSRSINKQILEAFEAALLQNAARPEMEYRIEAAGRTHTFYTHADLIAAIEKFRGFVKAEEDAKKIARGENTGKNILVRFN